MSERPKELASKASVVQATEGSNPSVTANVPGQGEPVDPRSEGSPVLCVWWGATECDRTDNALSGTYRVTGDRISLGRVGTTQGYCPPPPEDGFLRAIEAASGFSLSIREALRRPS